MARSAMIDDARYVRAEFDAKRAAGEWETPVPLDAGAGPRFPVEALPSVLADYVEAVAAFAEVPTDLPAVLPLAVFSAAVARKVSLEVRGDYREPLNVFGLVALPSGERKSSVVAETTAPLVAFERELLDRMGPEIAEAQSRRRVLEKELTAAEGHAARATGADRLKRDNARKNLARELSETEVAAEPRVMMSDATPEAIAQGLAEQGGRLAVFSPEGDVFALFKRYSKDGAPNFEVFLKAHAGDDLRVDRKHAKPVTVERPALTLGLAVQPDVLQGLAGDRVFRERGLLARFVYAVPSCVVDRTFNGPAVPEAVRAAYHDAVLWLCSWPGQSKVLALSIEAFTLWREYARAVQRQRRPGGRFASLLDWSGKLPGLVARLAGILHCVQGAAVGRITEKVDAATMSAAVKLGEYAADHALVAFGLMGSDPIQADARIIFDWLRRTGVRPSCTTRDSYRENRVLDAERARRAFELLESDGWVRPHGSAHYKGRPLEWDIYPGLWGDG